MGMAWLRNNCSMGLMVSPPGGVPCFLCVRAAGCGRPQRVYAGAALDHSGPGTPPRWARRALSAKFRPCTCPRYRALRAGENSNLSIVIKYTNEVYVTCDYHFTHATAPVLLYSIYGVLFLFIFILLHMNISCQLWYCNFNFFIVFS